MHLTLILTQARSLAPSPVSLSPLVCVRARSRDTARLLTHILRMPPGKEISFTPQHPRRASGTRTAAKIQDMSRLAIFPKLPRLDGGMRALAAEARRRWPAIRGVHLALDVVGDVTEARQMLAEHDHRVILSISSAGHDVKEVESKLQACAEGFGDVLEHVVVHLRPSCNGGPLSEDAAMDYLHHVLPLGAVLLEGHPSIGAGAREDDMFGGRPVHLHGITHATVDDDWGASISTYDATDLYPILRLSLDPDRARDHASGDVSDDQHGCLEHVDHLYLRPEFEHAPSSHEYWRRAREVFAIKASRGAREALVTVPMEASTPSFLRRISEEHTLAISSSSQFGVVDHEDCHDTQRRGEEDAHASTQHVLPRASFH